MFIFLFILLKRWGAWHEMFYEDLYETEDVQLLPKHWLWKRKEEWILKTDDHSEPGTSVFLPKRGAEACQEICKILGPEWEEKVDVLVTLKTWRFYVNDSHWVDFTCWSRWSTGYYAVQTIAVDSRQSVEELERLGKSKDFFPIPTMGWLGTQARNLS